MKNDICYNIKNLNDNVNLLIHYEESEKSTETERLLGLLVVQNLLIQKVYHERNTGYNKKPPLIDIETEPINMSELSEISATFIAAAIDCYCDIKNHSHPAWTAKYRLSEWKSINGKTLIQPDPTLINRNFASRKLYFTINL